MPDRHRIYLHEDRKGTQIYDVSSIDGPEQGAELSIEDEGRPWPAILTVLSATRRRAANNVGLASPDVPSRMVAT